MTFVVVGGGPTGVELAGALGEIANDTLRRDFRSINPQDARIILVEAMDRDPAELPAGSVRAPRRASSSGWASTSARGTRVVGHRRACGARRGRGGAAEDIPARTVLWAAGVQASSFARAVAAADGRRDRPRRADHGRAGPDDPGPPGDLRHRRRGRAAVEARTGPCPGVAQGGIQGGKYAGRGDRGAPRRRARRRSASRTAATSRSSAGCRGVTNIGWLGPFGSRAGSSPGCCGSGSTSPT